MILGAPGVATLGCGQVLQCTLAAVTLRWQVKLRGPAAILFIYLDGGNSALAIGFQSRPLLRPQKHYSSRHFRA